MYLKMIIHAKTYFGHVLFLFNLVFASANSSGCALTPERTDAATCEGSIDFSQISPSSLVHITLEKYTAKTLDSSSFAGVPILQSLEMIGGEVDIVTGGVFSALDELVLASAKFGEIKYPFCTTDTNLKVITIKESVISNIKQLLSSCKKLKRLTLNHISLSKVEDLTFKDVYLSDLDLSQNDMRSLDDTSLTSLAQLKTLSLSNNQISTISRNAFSGLTSLQVLRLDQNNLMSLPNNVFDELQSLKTLNLSGNSFQLLQRPVFEGLRNLNTLLLSENDIRNIDQLIFTSYGSLKELDLSTNNIEELNVDLFMGLSRLRTLKLNNNNIKNIQPRTFGPLESLEDLDLSSNNLETVSGDPFTDKNSVLKSLNLGVNNLRTVQPRSFQILMSLQKLFLNWNDLESFPLDSLGRTGSLEVLDLSHNEITQLENSEMRISELNIAHNRLTYLPESWYKNRSLRRMNFSRNPWQCSCLQAMRTYLKYRVTIPDQNCLTGKNPVCVIIEQGKCIDNNTVNKNNDHVIETFIRNRPAECDDAN